MNRKQFIITLLLALLSGLIGGVLSIWFLMPPSVLAQDDSLLALSVPMQSTDQDIAVGEITVRSITLLDENGNERISIYPGDILMLDPQRNVHSSVHEDDFSAFLALSPKVGEKHGVMIAVASAASILGPQATIWVNDENGKIVWRAP